MASGQKEHVLTIMPQGRTVKVIDGHNLLTVLRDMDAAPEAPCGGNGSCGKCKVVANGEEVLACQTMVEEDMTVEVAEKAATNIMTDGIGGNTGFDPVKPGYLLAFDIGTTTVVCYLLDKNDGRELAHASMLNPQAPYGADVISRIQASMNGELESQCSLIQDGMCRLVEQVCEEAGIDAKEVGTVCVVGNPTMQQLFMGIDPSNLATIPFSPVLTKTEERPAKDYLKVCSEAVLLVVPDISGYVGADTMGCVISTGMYASEEITLMVDIGTNGEMVLGSSKRMTACSTAAGPALEGAKIKFGMRGAPGAIDHVWVEDGKLACSVIGGGEARGICGSGLIDAVAAGLEAGLISEAGRIQNLQEIDGERFMRLSGDVYLTQNDIRELQLAKGAIAAGIELMCEELEIEVDSVDRVMLAGAFGSFMDPEKACAIGLLPPELKDRIKAVGNAAGSGARMMACDRAELERAGELVAKIDFIELADKAEFQYSFVEHMSFE